jgi:response regulator RpfG family c-di-GMP phosphodiesterase
MVERACAPGKTDGASTRTVLLVAVDVSVLKMLEMALKVEYECEVLPFRNGSSALEAIKGVRPDLMVIHSLLLSQSAHDLADQLHRIEGLERVPTILTHVPTASQSESQGRHLIVLGLPFNLQDFYAAVNSCFGYPQ